MAVVQGSTSSTVTKSMSVTGESRINFIITNTGLVTILVNLFSLGPSTPIRLGPKNLELKTGKSFEVKDISFNTNMTWKLDTTGAVDYYVWTTISQSGQSIFQNEDISITGGGVGSLVVNEIPSGLVNGINATFNTAYDFIPESVSVIVNGIIQ